MSVRVVCDASALVALLLDLDRGEGVTRSVADAELIAPELVLFETANVIRRQALRAAVSADDATQAHVDLLSMGIELWPYPELAARAWELREDLTVYDASYVAVAELAGATLVTLDVRLARSPGLRCPVVTP